MIRPNREGGREGEKQRERETEEPKNTRAKRK